jgi:hypothetical protein
MAKTAILLLLHHREMVKADVHSSAAERQLCRGRVLAMIRRRTGFPVRRDGLGRPSYDAGSITGR